MKPSHVSGSGTVHEAPGNGITEITEITDTELDAVFRVHRWRSLRVASVQRMIVVVIMLGAVLVHTDYGAPRWAPDDAVVVVYALTALSVLILVYSPASRLMVPDRALFILAMVDVVAIVGFKLLSPGGHIPLLLMVLVPRMVALDLSGRRATVGLTFAFVAFTVSILQDPVIVRQLGWPKISLIVLIYGFLCGTALFAVIFRQRYVNEIARITASRDALLAETMTASERERREISEAIHDGPLQDVLAARRDIADFAKKSPAEPLQRAVASLDDASRRLREATFELHPAVLEQVGLGAAVEKLAVLTAERAGITIATDVDHPDRTATDPMVFGVVRELLSNVVRHSEATRVSVKLKVRDGTCRLDVVDDGIGITADVMMRRLAEGHIGLASQRARVEAAGGSFEIVDVPSGAHIRVEWPL
ncbi:MAG: ATP-binding protein [Actinomycetota bacterium]|uniref:ATP-binding protein n=1 Tax=Mycobacterium lentiflavum TaxID=141349 RepID=A0ABY3UYG1_MYCLN|nr:ATP-binding protein [Mycobacterium lentiflavum]MEE3066971.1 ATP-binding protein [Actinomycetota bacterium]ULP43734.1 ATP-binding protein [Mycobacterium lentiflavum]